MGDTISQAAFEWIDHKTLSIAILEKIHAQDGMNNISHDHVVRAHLIKQFEISSSMSECAETLSACGRQIVLGWSGIAFFL